MRQSMEKNGYWLCLYVYKRKYKEPENVVCFLGGFFTAVTKCVIFKSTWPRCYFMWTDFSGLYRHQKLCYRCHWLYPSSSSASSWSLPLWNGYFMCTMKSLTGCIHKQNMHHLEIECLYSHRLFYEFLPLYEHKNLMMSRSVMCNCKWMHLNVK